MELDRLHAGHVLDLPYPVLVLVHENADRHDKGRELGDDISRLLGIDIARALLVKVKAQRVCPALRRVQRVVQIGNAANFYFYHKLYPCLSQRRRDRKVLNLEF